VYLLSVLFTFDFKINIKLPFNSRFVQPRSQDFFPFLKKGKSPGNEVAFRFVVLVALNGEFKRFQGFREAVYDSRRGMITD